MCYSCFLHNPNNEILLDDMCSNPETHEGVCPLVSVAWNEQEQLLEEIRPLPQLSNYRGFALCNGDWCKGGKCTFAHSELEKRAWNYELNAMRKGSYTFNLKCELYFLHS